MPPSPSPFGTAVAAHAEAPSTAAFDAWWAERQKANRFEVTRIPFAALDDWDFDPDTGNLAHSSGRFFTIEGLDVAAEQADGTTVAWRQPIIHQPEIGILGILTKRFDGVPHFLMQAKMEPGNINTLQLSPTIQATRSNYTRVHRGTATRYLEFFRGPGRGTVLVDSLQSEQGSWFWHKHNRNIVVEATGDVPEHEDFHWLTLGQIRRLLRVDNLVNMDARTVLSCMPLTPSRPSGDAGAPAADDPFTAALLRSYGTGAAGHAEAARPELGLHTWSELLSWFTEMKTRAEWRTRLIPLARAGNWRRTDDEIASVDGSGTFRVIGARVKAATREVTSWTQPLLAPCEQGLAAFLARPVNGVLHLLVKAQAEPGLLDTIEIAPTVQLPAAAAGGRAVPFADEVTKADPERVRFDTVLSEEGGRFHHAETRYQIIEAPADFPVDEPDEYRWMTVRQLTDLLRHGHYLNVEARSLLACVHSLW